MLGALDKQSPDSAERIRALMFTFDDLANLMPAAIAVLVKNGKGVLAQLASAISSAEADITHLDMGNEPAHDTAELKLLVSVRDRQHLADVLRTLRRAPTVMKVSRVKP